MSQPNKIGKKQQSTISEVEDDMDSMTLAIGAIGAVIRQLRDEGLTVKIDASPDGLRLVIPGLGLADTGRGTRHIVKVDASPAKAAA